MRVEINLSMRMWRTFLARARHLTLKPHDLATAGGRQRERYRLAAWNTAANAASAAAGMFSLIVTTAMTLPYLGAERFGVWMAISSLASVLSFLDLGVGNVLVNLVARAHAGPNPSTRLNEIVKRALSLMLGIGLLAAMAILCAAGFWPLERFIKVENLAIEHEMHQTLVVFALIFAASVPLGGLQRVCFGLQKAWITHLTKTASYLVSPLLVSLLLQEPVSIPTLLLATYGMHTLSSLLLLPWLVRMLSRGHSSVRQDAPSLRQDLKSFLSTGSLFFALQVGGIVGWGTDALIAAAVLGASAVAQLTIAQRLFQCVAIPLSILNAPLWAAYADASARDDAVFIRHTLARALCVTLAGGLISSAAVWASSDWLITAWLGPGHNIPSALLLAVAIWTVMEAVGNCFAMYLNGCNIIKPQLIVVLTFCIVAIPLKIALPETIGIAGVVVATIVAYSLCVALPYATILKKYVLAGLGHKGASHS